MLEDNEPLFSHIHSLPVITHSVAIATRTPTVGYAQQSKYMPDLGGVLEIPGSHIKNNALASGFPFSARSIVTHINWEENTNDEGSREEIVTDSLAVTSYLNSLHQNKYSIIRAVDRQLKFEIIDEDSSDTTSHLYARGDFSSKISAIKYAKDLEDYLLVSFNYGLKLLKLNKNYEPSDHVCCRSCDIHPDGTSAFETVSSIKEEHGFQLKDICLNSFNRSILATATDNYETYQVKLYDLSRGSKNFFQLISWASTESGSSTPNQNADYEKKLRHRTIRTFRQVIPAIRGIQQLDTIPSHLVNMLVTTSDQTALIDPRLDRPGQIYSDRAQSPSFYPIEFQRRTKISGRNSYQFYSLTNVHVRAFDTRYPKTPMSQINHMLDSSNYKYMNLELINYDQKNLETLCLSSSGRLCFISYDQSGESGFINPKSAHLPYHDVNVSRVDDSPDAIFGLGVKCSGATNLTDELFSILQLSAHGETIIRKYNRQQLDDYENEVVLESQARHIVKRNSVADDDAESSRRHRTRTLKNRELKDRDVIDSEMISEDNVDYIKILDEETFVDIGDKLGSLRARERFEKMKNKLDKA